jgi:DNA primase
MTISDIKQIPILDVAYRLGIEVIGHKSNCFAHEDSNPSLSFNKQLNYFKCFGCGIGGSSIDLVKHRLNTTTGEAIRWFESQYNLDNKIEQELGHNQKGQLSTQTLKSNLQVPHSSFNRVQSKDGKQFSVIYRELMNMGDIEEAISYLGKRGIDAELVKKYGIRVLDSTKADILKDRYDIETLLDSGLFARSSKTGALYYTLFAHTLVFPYFDHDGETILTLQGRNIKGKSDHKYQMLPGIETVPYNLQVLDTERRIYLCEGAIDVLSALQLGLKGPLGIAGVNNFKTHYFEIFDSCEVIVASDTDNAGHQFYRDLVKQFLKRGKKVGILDWKKLKADYGVVIEVKDLNDIARLADYKHKQQLASSHMLYSHVVHEEFQKTDEGIAFKSGVIYDRSELELLKGKDDESIKAIHLIKKMFNGRLVRG